MNQQGKGPLNGQDIAVTNPHEISAVYANSLGASGTLTDFTLFFTQVGQLPGPKGPIQTNELKAVVTLPLTMVPALMNVLQQVAQQGKAMQQQQVVSVSANPGVKH